MWLCAVVAARRATRGHMPRDTFAIRCGARHAPSCFEARSNLDSLERAPLLALSQVEVEDTWWGGFTVQIRSVVQMPPALQAADHHLAGIRINADLVRFVRPDRQVHQVVVERIGDLMSHLGACWTRDAIARA